MPIGSENAGNGYDTCYSLGKRLKELRKEKGISQQVIANLFKVTRPCVCYWETGKRIPDYQTLIALSDFYNVTVDYIIGRSASRKFKVKEDGLLYKNQNLLDISQLQEEGRRDIHDYYQFLLDKQLKKSMNQ